MKIELKSLENKVLGDITLSDAIFGQDVRPDLIARVIKWQLARRHQGTHKTKEIGDVSGTTKKPFRQKGTGNARQGSLRSPQMRGGAVIFGPVVRSHAFKLQKKVRKLALMSAISAKAKDGKLIVIDKADLKSMKTIEAQKTLSALSLKNALFVDGEVVNENFLKAFSNVPFVDVLPQQGINVYDIVKHENLVLTEAAVKKLEERLK